MEHEPNPDRLSTTRDAAVRIATPNDIPALFAVRTSVRENHLDLAQLADRGVTPDAIADLLASGHSRTWVVEGARGVCGFSMADARSGSIFAIFVSPGVEGRGYGRALLQVAEEWLFEAGWVMVGPADHGDVRYEKSRAV